MIILASQSPRRQELLKLITNNFEIKVSNVDETLPSGISPKDAVLYLSKIKAEPFKNYSDIIIGADTVVALDGKILGKPKNDENAREMLKFLSGKAHSVFTGVTLIKGDIARSFAVETKVKFFDLTDEEIDEYIKTGEPADKAGAYGIQGYGSLLVEKIDGDYFNVVGLPVSKLARELLAIK
ncbi:MAG: Maf family protein [Eubacterium coprostanoligenes]|uniref:Maf family protein n=1 Tax=Eubacterium coprostanoligenes TaxID=290054 RepID=UPI0023F4722A|nr:Maf family protein [Eubacterium coprostanoligenes]MDD7357646.1 Maf family protein [Eubacterium coprostanoligenes]